MNVTKKELATATRILARHGLIGQAGHVSFYPGSGSRYLLSPAAGFRKDLCRERDVWDLDFEDDWKMGIPLELHMHSEAHRALPNVGSVVHVHSPALTQLSILAEPPGQALTFFSGFWPDPLPVYGLSLIHI